MSTPSSVASALANADALIQRLSELQLDDSIMNNSPVSPKTTNAKSAVKSPVNRSTSQKAVAAQSPSIPLKSPKSARPTTHAQTARSAPRAESADNGDSLSTTLSFSSIQSLLSQPSTPASTNISTAQSSRNGIAVRPPQLPLAPTPASSSMLRSSLSSSLMKSLSSGPQLNSAAQVSSPSLSSRLSANSSRISHNDSPVTALDQSFDSNLSFSVQYPSTSSRPPLPAPSSSTLSAASSFPSLSRPNAAHTAVDVSASKDKMASILSFLDQVEEQVASEPLSLPAPAQHVDEVAMAVLGVTPRTQV